LNLDLLLHHQSSSGTGVAVMSLALLERPSRHDSSQRLSSEEERSLAIRIKRGDQQAVERLVLANLGLVGSIARTFLGHGLSFEDMKQEGTRGLLTACAGFDPETHDVRFATYAAYSIRNAIQQAISTHGSMIRLPDYMVRLRSKYRRTVGEIVAENVENADAKTLGPGAAERGTDHEIAARLGISLETLDLVRKSEIGRTQGRGDSDDDDLPPLLLPELRLGVDRFFVLLIVISAPSARAVAPSYIEALATSISNNAATIDWNS